MKNNENLITAGEMGRLSQSTKRTVLWYTKNGLLKPIKVNSKGYRFYSTEQIIDFQVILLLRSLNFSIDEIKKFLKQKKSLKEIFKAKEEDVKKEIERLQMVTKKINSYYSSYEENGLLITPTIKQQESFEIYYLQKVGPYAKIYDYLNELKSYFEEIPQDATYLVIFLVDTYAPKKDIFKVAVVKTKDMQLKEEAREIVKVERIPSFKSLSYTHIGPPLLISMIWMQLQQYRENKGLQKNRSLGFHTFEFYKKSGMNDYHDENTMISELNLPIL